MRVISSDEIEAVLRYPELIETLRRAYRSKTVTPAPAHFEIKRPGAKNGALHANPAWTNFLSQGHTGRGYIGCGLTVELPGNNEAFDGPDDGSGVYLLLSGATGQPVALFDAPRLTAWRTCAMHALAARYLAREDAHRLLILGTHPLLTRLVSAYAAVRDIRSVLLLEGAETQLKPLSSIAELAHITFGTSDDLSGALAGADMICCASPLTRDLISSDLAEGIHIDVICSDFQTTPSLLETARVFVAERASPDNWHAEDLAADLYDLTQGEKAGRRFYSQITLFSAGTLSGLADLATAGHVFLRT